ncbi:MAG: T9SS type A sorting domain-containing protein [bacterium]
MKKFITFSVTFCLFALLFASASQAQCLESITAEKVPCRYGQEKFKITYANPTGHTLYAHITCGTCMSQCIALPPCTASQTAYSDCFSSCAGQPKIEIFSKPNCTGETCTVLPVSLESFSAKRDDGDVTLTWETASESNNRGFEIDASMDGAAWDSVAFVSSRASGGSSSEPLSYQFRYATASQDAILYRIVQIDADGRKKISNVFKVPALAGKGVTKVISSSSSGAFGIEFGNPRGIYDVALLDLQGRLHREWREKSGILYATVSVPTGIYIVRVIAADTKEVTARKVFIR